MSDRGLYDIAKMNLASAVRDLEESDEIYVNSALFNISSCVEKLVKFLCACYGIDYDYTHFIASYVDKLLEKEVYIPKLIKESTKDYGLWATRGRYIVSQMETRTVVLRHIKVLHEWFQRLDRQFGRVK
jgi:HEPN domain-containing protein